MFSSCAKTISALAVFLTTSGNAQGDGVDHVLEVHGSGTTNPSKCLWLLQTQMQQRTKVPIHMTYRAVGSGTGIEEFMGVNNTADFAYVNYNDFGSADIPLPSDEYAALQAAGKEMIHLPFVLGSVGVFYHALTDQDSDAENQPTVNLTACHLAKIFRREITTWDDEELLPDNPNLSQVIPAGVTNPPIHVARRVLGSSSTASLTEFLNNGCPASWPAELVGKEIVWPEDTMECEGSAGMSKCLVDRPGAIGYMESGHGWAENFKEVELKNKFGTFLTSRQAAQRGTIGNAAGSIPSSADMDFGDVSLINKPGEYTWPITLMSYIFVRKDLPATMDNPQERTLLKKFLQSLYDDAVIGQCKQFGFVPAPKNVRDIALAGIDMLQMAGPNDSAAPVEWTYETETLPGEGAGPFVISDKRRSYAEVQISDLQSMTTGHAQILDLWDLTADGQATDANSFATTKSTSSLQATSKQIQAALIMSSISIALWVALLAFVIGKRLFCHHASSSDVA